VTVYAFEPNPQQMPRLRFCEAKLSNYHVIQSAVSNISGNLTFNIITGDEWSNEHESGGGGLCSLNKIIQHEKWKHSKEITVSVIRLEDFIEENKIEEIDYLHCDVQGKDLEVLMGLGKHISKVKKGCLEMPRCMRTKYYDTQVYDAADAVKFLHENGFIVDSIEVNDEFVNEVNIYYHRISDKDKVMVQFKPLQISDII
jgi:FkbM family methyltransferase